MTPAEMIREMMGPILARTSPWHYLWSEHHEARIGRVLDAAHGYEPGSGLWVVDVAFSGRHPIACHAFKGQRLAPPPPFLVVAPRGDARYLTYWSRGLALYPVADLAEQWRLAWHEHGGCYGVTLGQWREASVRAAKRARLEEMRRRVSGAANSCRGCTRVRFPRAVPGRHVPERNKTMKHQRGLTVLELMIAFIVLAGVGSILTIVLSKDNGSAKDEAVSFGRSLGLNVRGSTCMDRDTDGDGYVSCTLSIEENGALKTLPIECARSISMASGCRMQKFPTPQR